MFTKVYEVWIGPYENVSPLPELVQQVQEVIDNIANCYSSASCKMEIVDSGVDAEMVNEYCHIDQSLWDELDSYYEAITGELSFEDANLIAIKKYRAEILFSGNDPGLIEDTKLAIGLQDADFDYFEEDFADNYEESYEEWKSNLSVGELEFPHSLSVGSGYRHDYVERLIREKEMQEETEMAMMNDMYR